MRYPPRLAHLATRQVVVAKLAPTYAESHQVDDDEAISRLERAFAGPLLDELLSATWQALQESTKRLDETALLEKVALTLRDRPNRPGRVTPMTPALGAFLVMADLEAGTASDAVRRVMEQGAGQAKAREGMVEAGQYLAKELTRGR
jgi:hypothetical protein